MARKKQAKANVGRPGATKGRTFRAEVLTQDEVRAMIRACSSKAPTGIRNRALIALLWGSGLRISEALALYPKDVDITAGTVRVLCGKGRKDRTPFIIHGSLGGHYERWMDKRQALGMNGRHPLFCTLKGTSISAVYVRAMLKREAEAAGIEKRVHPHGLRHTHASMLRDAGIQLNVISIQLGHSNEAITCRYLNRFNPAQVMEALRGLNWGSDGKEGTCKKNHGPI